MKDFVIQQWCDLCWDESSDTARVEAVSRVVIMVVVDEQLRRPVLRELDVCERHGKELAQLSAVVARLGVPLGDSKPLSVEPRASGLNPMKPPSYGQRADCPVCRKTMTQGGIINHIWNVHIRRARPDAPTACPDCGQTFPHNDPASVTRAVGKHRQNTHGYDPLAEAVAIYQSMGKTR